MTVDKKHSPRCFMDIEIDGEHAGRIIMELFTDVCPITCENFRALCTGEKGVGRTTDKPLHYKGAPFHRVVKNFVIQGGDFVAGNGTGGESIYGGQFKDENFDIPHDKQFLLSMSNRGKDSNGSQFFITTQAAPHLNGKHTVFGQVIQGQEVVTKIESIKTDQSCRPTKEVKISNCGELVLKIQQKERKRRVTTESSDSESEEERAKRKRKHKHSKKHKKEKRDVMESNSTSSRKEEDSGCMVDPEEIPTVPINNFLMRRTSPLGDRNRRPSQRESYSFGRPVVSRSGRKIKGRGFMRYRTPSRSTSRSGSETPPHWKQAQSRLRNIKDVVLPKKEIIPAGDSESQADEMEDSMPRGNVLHSRLGMVSKSAEDNRQKDARLIMRENRRNREWSPEGSPPRNTNSSRGMPGGSPLRSTVVVTPNFQKDSEPDRFRRNDWRGGRRGRTPDRRPPDRFNNNDSNRNWGRRQVMDTRPNRKEPEKLQRSEKESVKNFKSLTSDLFRYRKDHVSSEESTDQEKDSKNKDRQVEKSKNRDEKSIDSKNKDRQEEKSRNRDEGRDKSKDIKRKKPLKEQAKKFQSLASDLYRYRKDHVSSDDSSEEDNKKKKEEMKKDKISEKISAPKNISKKDGGKTFKTLANDLFRYHKDRSDYSSDGSSSGKNPIQKTRKDASTLPNISEENTTTSNGEPLKDNNTISGSVSLPETVTELSVNNSSKIVIPGIYDSNSNETSLDAENHQESQVSNVETQSNNVKEDDKIENLGENLNFRDKEDKDKVSFKVAPVVKEKRRWDMQETESRKVHKVEEQNQVVFQSATYDCILPDIIPLPEETRSVTGLKTAEMKSSGQEDIQELPNVPESNDRPDDFIRSRSITPIAEVPRNRSVSPMKSSKPHREHPKSEEPDQEHYADQSDTNQIKMNEPHRSKSRSESPIYRASSSKAKDRSISKSPTHHSPTRRKISVSPGKRTKKARSKSPISRRSKSPGSRRTRQSKSPASRRARPSKSRSRSRSKSRDRNRRRRSRSPVNIRSRRSLSRDRGSRFRRYGTRSPDRRGGYQRRYAKSPSLRGRLGGRSGTRRSRSRSAVRRRRTRRSSSSSGSSSSGSSSSRSNRRKKSAKRSAKGRKRSSSSSSSTRSKKSDSESAST